ncbi:MAG: metallophosphoesterase family protein [Bacteroidales bacterium]
MAYIGLLSDTHTYLDTALKKFLDPVDEIWHAGDFGDLKTYKELAAFKPLKGVYGNCDGKDIRSYVPYIQNFTIEGMKILMMHIGGYPGRYDRRAFQLIIAHNPDIFVCGHSHILKIMNDRKFNMLDINPGAAGISGFHQVRTALRFKIEKHNISDMEVGEWPR